MKKVFILACLMAVVAVNAMAEKKPWKIIDMEDVVRAGGNCDYDDETCTATFTGPYDRWIDLPGVSGDLSDHTVIDLNILKSTCMLRVVVVYKASDGTEKQEEATTFYHSMKRTITEPKVVTVDLAKNGNITTEMLENVVYIRIAMSKAVDDNAEPWITQFGKTVIY